jgi:hypothetical protein
LLQKDFAHPKQTSSGGKDKLGNINEQGQRYLCSFFTIKHMAMTAVGRTKSVPFSLKSRHWTGRKPDRGSSAEPNDMGPLSPISDPGRLGAGAFSLFPATSPRAVAPALGASAMLGTTAPSRGGQCNSDLSILTAPLYQHLRPSIRRHAQWPSPAGMLV